MGAKWQELGQAIEGETSAYRVVGHLHTLNFDDAFGDAIYPDSDQKIAPRLGAADRLVIFDPPQPGPFNQDVNQLALRHHQISEGVSPDTLPTGMNVLPERAGFEFSMGEARYRYDRFGLELQRTDDKNQPTSG
jgi:CRISPR-associated endonuclease/helicase Cas3